jgi:hypothetical protein
LEPDIIIATQSLRAINQNDKANEVMELFSQNQPMMAEPNFLNKIPLSTSQANSEGTLLKMRESIRSILIMELLFIRIN